MTIPPLDLSIQPAGLRRITPGGGYSGAARGGYRLWCLLGRTAPMSHRIGMKKPIRPRTQ